MFFIKMNQKKELVWGPGFLIDGNEYVVDTYHVDTIISTYKGTYKNAEKATPYIVLYDVTKYDANTKTFHKTKCKYWICYRTDKLYNVSEY